MLRDCAKERPRRLIQVDEPQNRGFQADMEFSSDLARSSQVRPSDRATLGERI